MKSESPSASGTESAVRRGTVACPADSAANAVCIAAIAADMGRAARRSAAESRVSFITEYALRTTVGVMRNAYAVEGVGKMRALFFAQIRLADFLVFAELGCQTLQADLAGLEDVAAMRDGE